MFPLSMTEEHLLYKGMEQIKGNKDPVRNPVQAKMESLFKSNYEKSLKVMQTRIIKIIKSK